MELGVRPGHRAGEGARRLLPAGALHVRRVAGLPQHAAQHHLGESAKFQRTGSEKVKIHRKCEFFHFPLQILPAKVGMSYNDFVKENNKVKVRQKPEV